MISIRRKKLAGKKDKRYSLYLDIYQKGSPRKYESLNLYLTDDRHLNKEVLRLAEAIKAKRQLELQANEHGFIPDFKKRINFITYFEQIRKEKNKERKSSFYNNTYKHLVDFTGGNVQINSVNEKWLKQFSDYLHTKVSHNSVYCYFNCLHAVLNKAVKDRILQVNPFIYLDHKDKPKQNNVFKTWLTFDEINILAHAPCNKPDIKRAFMFGIYTGMRYGDIKALKWQDIEDNQIKFKQKKTGEIVYLPISETVMNILNDNCNILPMPEVSVFNLQSDRINQTSLKKWIEQAGIKKTVTWHTARHTFATQAIEAGVDLYTVSKLLGHSSINLTQIYARVTSEKMKKAVNSLPGIKIS